MYNENKIELPLCYRCYKEFDMNPDTVIRRANILQTVMEPCCFCQVRFGYDYVIEEKEMSSMRLKNKHI